MRYLVDTVALIMWWTQSSRLGGAAHDVLAAAIDPIYLSAVSVWEVANKNRIGKLDQVENFQEQFPGLLIEGGFLLLDVTADHAMRAGYLPGSHRDLFDRLLAGQALVEGLTVLTNDPALAAFGCRTVW